MKNKIPTAEEQIKEFKNGFDGLVFQNEAEISITKFLMIEFAKLHVKAALETVVENINPEKGKYIISNKESILSLYNLDNIK